MGCAVSTSARLANVVCRAFRLPKQPLVSATRNSSPRRSSGSDVPACIESVRRQSAKVHSSCVLRLSLHGLVYRSEDGRCLDTNVDRRLLSNGESNEIRTGLALVPCPGPLQKRFQRLHHDVGNPNITFSIEVNQIFLI